LIEKDKQIIEIYDAVRSAVRACEIKFRTIVKNTSAPDGPYDTKNQWWAELQKPSPNIKKKVKSLIVGIKSSYPKSEPPLRLVVKRIGWLNQAREVWAELHSRRL